MYREKINRISATAPVVMSLLALCMPLLVVTTGWERHLDDEGAAAHIFQLLIVFQVPFILAFLVTADWRKFGRIARTLALQVAAVVLAFAPVAYFKL